MSRIEVLEQNEWLDAMEEAEDVSRRKADDESRRQQAASEAAAKKRQLR